MSFDLEWPWTANPKDTLSCKRTELGHILLLHAGGKSYMGGPMAQSHLTLSIPERSQPMSLKYWVVGDIYVFIYLPITLLWISHKKILGQAGVSAVAAAFLMFSRHNMVIRVCILFHRIKMTCYSHSIHLLSDEAQCFVAKVFGGMAEENVLPLATATKPGKIWALPQHASVLIPWLLRGNRGSLQIYRPLTGMYVHAQSIFLAIKLISPSSFTLPEVTPCRLNAVLVKHPVSRTRCLMVPFWFYLFFYSHRLQPLGNLGISMTNIHGWLS